MKILSCFIYCKFVTKYLNLVLSFVLPIKTNNIMITFEGFEIDEYRILHYYCIYFILSSFLILRGAMY